MKKTILAITSGFIHPKWWIRRRFLAFLRENSGYTIKKAGSIRAAANLSADKYSAVIIYLHRRGISETIINNLKSFVEEGGSILAFHSATASFKKFPEYFKLLGGRFTGHDEVKDFEIIPVNKTSEVFGECRSFSVYDELYRHEVYEGITVHYYAEENGKREPAVWTKQIGKGKIIYYEPGHCSNFLDSDEMKRIILKGLEWAVS